MNDPEKILRQLAAGELSVEQALAALEEAGAADLGFARIDHQRERRCGFPEVVYGAGKTAGQLLEIARHFADRRRDLLVTRLAEEAAAVITAEFPAAAYDGQARTLTMLAEESRQRPDQPGRVLVVTAGTSDLGVAGECVNSLKFFGFAPELVTDVGVAGLHRLLARFHELTAAAVVIVIAGMEGALPSVVGGLVAAPVIAVPTSMGYGASFAGLAALLGMLTSCAGGITVTNIDNGFGAACAALRILGRRETP